MSSIVSAITQHSNQLLILGLGAALGFAVSKTCCTKKCTRGTGACKSATTTPSSSTTTTTTPSTPSSSKGPVVDYSKKTKEEIIAEFKQVFTELKQFVLEDIKANYEVPEENIQYVERVGIYIILTVLFIITHFTLK